MKTIRFAQTVFIFAWLAGAAAWAFPTSGTKEKPASRIEVVFFEPEKYTDVRDSSFGSDKGRDAILEQLKTYLQEHAQSYLAEGQRLVITVTDVDLAGEYEPWRSGALRDVRIVKEIYPPRINLSFKLVNADGETEKAGVRQLRDLAFQQSASPANNDSLRYEKALLDDWLRTEFRGAKKN